ncbi:hypothetical protein AMATHDRAFT_140955 [Amanita thiersii Skay4041]|uniref:DNA topoisomerase (ATP-hydrolyzing) n=1 Tax=Amanita thiersii Skay4041 TaxID=703135 RepID=A0A2A9NW97_9AGAR|nr:hypothetical protein AMATHDRAFT_140955 [Amanita thiersii Skay4041]
MADLLVCTSSTRTVVFPRKASTGSARSLAQLLRVLDTSHEALIRKEPITKRELFYRDVELFGSQRVVDTLLDDLVATFGIERCDLNIRASSKGLVYGEGVLINLCCGDCISTNYSTGTLIPTGEDVEAYQIIGDPHWVLIVEKEAIFNTFCSLRLANHPAMPGQGLIITGKGYPDVATRSFVKFLADTLPLSVPLLALVDGDPYGLDILSVYKFGSQSLRHENDKLVAGRVTGIGIWTADLTPLGIQLDDMLPITNTDERKRSLTMSSVLVSHRRELMRILYTRRKAEIEILLSMTQVQDERTFSTWTPGILPGIESLAQLITTPSRPTSFPVVLVEQDFSGHSGYVASNKSPKSLIRC